MSSLLRVLAVTNTYPTASTPGDSPQILDQIAALKAHDVEVDILYVDRHKGIRGYITAAWKIILLSFQRRKYDLIHAYYGHCGFLARLQIRYPIVVTFLGSDLLHPRDGAIGKVVARFADVIIVQSKEMKRISQREDAHIIPFGINLHLFTPFPIQDARQELGFALDEKLVLFPWNPDRAVKRIDLVHEAILLLKHKQIPVRLVIIFDQPHEIVAKYMNACNVMVLASDHEGSPMALREAMACNLPIISVDVGDVRQIIENVQGCFLCKRDPTDIAEKLSLVLECSDRTKGEYVIRQHDAAWSADQVIKIYTSLLKTRRTRRVEIN
jgi:glycosyltransferase involved in cell wall biosynthesis